MTVIIEAEKLNLFYGDFQALKDVNVKIHSQMITAIIGPSGCGKSTLLRTFNRMNDVIDCVSTNGKILFQNQNVLDPKCDLIDLRQKIGMVFQRPNPFPLSIYDNVVYGLRIRGEKRRAVLDEAVERNLESVLMLSEVKDKLRNNALSVTLEQQQRLCIARALAVKPEILLMDEPCSALDPVATARIEELMFELRKTYSVIIVTHNMQQAARVSQETGFMLLGELVEFGNTADIFTTPRDKRTEDYVTGRYG